ncbi:MAG: 50S ribosomal protein L13 [Planctomycetes bacterium]|nr:50S ribosomal protein L13 [Planctomycetota bacterium]
MKTYMAKTGEVEQKWHWVDASGKILGRLAAKIAPILMGKHRPTYTPHTDTGDFVIVVNAEKVAVSRDKDRKKEYYYHTGYPGGLRSYTLGDLRKKNPTEIIRLAVRRMLPKTKLGKKMFSKLKVYAGPDHPHSAQNPEPLDT